MGVLLLFMCIGVALGATVFPDKLRGLNSNATLFTTGLLIFCMGASLGAREAFLEEIAEVGASSVLFCCVPVVCSVIAVFFLTSFFMADITKRHQEESHSSKDNAGESSFGGETVMIGVAVGALVLGVAYGLSGLHFGFAGVSLDVLVANSDYVLYALMFFVGISVGGSRGLVSKMREYRLRVFVVPFGIIAGSIVGGVLCSLILDLDWAVGAAVASGLGWYSLSGPMMSGIAGAQIGSITFLSNLLREIVSFFTIPWISKHLNYPTCIAPAAATSEDTTLPMLIRCTNSETVVLSVVNGVLCSIAVPFLIEFFHGFM